MDPRLEAIDKLLADQPEDFDAAKELSFAEGFTSCGPSTPPEMRWQAMCLIARAQEIEDTHDVPASALPTGPEDAEARERERIRREGRRP